MRAVILLIVIVLAAGQYQPLVYESFEVKHTYGTKPEMQARTCIFFSGYTLVAHRLVGNWEYACPRRRGVPSADSPGVLVD